MAIEQADNIQTGAPKPTDSRYYNNLIPYLSCSEVNSTVGSGVRYSGLTVNILGTEYWYKDGITDPDLVEKTTGGELNWTGSTANGIGTYVDGTHICAEPNLTFDVNLGEPTLTISAATVNRALLNYCAGSSLIKLGFVDGTPDQFSLWDGADNVLFNVYPTTGTELFYNAAKKLETVTGGATITGIACATTCLKAPIVQLTTGAADGCVLTSNAAGCGVWATPSGGGGINMSGSTANGITTYVDADTICSEPNLTFDGSILNFSQGATRTISIAQATDGGAGDSLNICAGAGDDDTSPLAGGNLRLEGGTGSADTDTGNGGVGGYGILCGGVGGAGHASANGGCGGAAYVRGGAGGDGDTDGCGGHVYVCGGVSSDNVAGDVYVCGGAGQVDGCVAIFHDTTKRLHTTTTGMYTTGIHTITSNVVFPSPTTTSKFICGEASTTPSNLLLVASESTDATTGGILYLQGGKNSSTGAGGTLNVCGGCTSGSGAGGDVNIIAGLSTTGIAGSTYVCGGKGGGGGGGAGYVGGSTILRAGTGGAGNTGGAGGVVEICGGCGWNSTTDGAGGDVSIQGGCSYGGGGLGGVVEICGGYGSTCGDVYLKSNTTTKLYTASFGVCVVSCGKAVDWVATSDCRLKKDVIPISNALSIVNQLCGVCYHLCGDEDCEDRIGLIAQDVDKVLSAVVSHDEPGENDMKFGITDEVLGIKYNKLTAVLIEAVKELKGQNSCLQNQINELKNN